MAARDKMPAPLDLTRSKLLVSSPRMSLRRGASYNNEKCYDKTPVSATSSRFNFNHLLFTSPPPSPSLPALVPRPRQSPTHPRPSRVFRVVFWLTLFLLILYFATFTFRGVAPVSIPYLTGEEFESIRQDELPNFPTPIVVADTNGYSKWTVSIPPNANFPLPLEDYRSICAKCREVAAQVTDMRHKNPPPQQSLLGRPTPKDKYFIDVPEAETSGLLPSFAGLEKALGSIIGENQQTTATKPVCESSLTFVLETTDAGIGNTLMELWIFYGLAKKQGRDFFIDDSRWAYGKYTDIFQPPPAPDCRPPRRRQMLPCPTQARHLVVTSDTATELWGDSLNPPRSSPGSEKASKELFSLASEGYHALFELNKDDAKYVDERIKELRGKVSTGGLTSNDGLVVGMHVRRGDRHPFEYQYRNSYIPTNTIAETARDLVADAFRGAGKGGTDDKAARRQSVLVLASDDPTVYESEDFADAERAQELIQLARKQEDPTQGELDKTKNRRVMHHFEDEAFGWEGGFFAPMFWNLGLSTVSASNAATMENMKLPPSEETLRLRSLISRAYLMDLAALAGASDRVVCTVSAMGCRLLAVMMGWEHAMEKGGWVNVDGVFEWTALAA